MLPPTPSRTSPHPSWHRSASLHDFGGKEVLSESWIFRMTHGHPCWEPGCLAAFPTHLDARHPGREAGLVSTPPNPPVWLKTSIFPFLLTLAPLQHLFPPSMTVWVQPLIKINLIRTTQDAPVVVSPWHQRFLTSPGASHIPG